MPNTMTLISSATVGSGGAASIDFTSIPGTYTDLMILYSLRAANAGIYADTSITFTGATGSGGKSLYSLGTTAGTYSPNGSQNFYGESVGNNATASTFSNGSFYIPNYTSTSNKSLSGDGVGENNGSNSIMVLTAGGYTSSGAITAASITVPGTTFLQHSTAYLYGIKNS